MQEWLNIKGNEDKLETFLESCSIIIKQDGSCKGIMCDDCPGDSEYNRGIHCNRNGFSRDCNYGARHVKSSSILFLETHGGKMLKREKLMRFIADELGVEFGEKFNLKNATYSPFVITEEGFFDYAGDDVTLNEYDELRVEKISRPYTVIVDGKEYEVTAEEKNVILNGIKGDK